MSTESDEGIEFRFESDGTNAGAVRRIGGAVLSRATSVIDRLDAAINSAGGATAAPDLDQAVDQILAAMRAGDEFATRGAIARGVELLDAMKAQSEGLRGIVNGAKRALESARARIAPRHPSADDGTVGVTSMNAVEIRNHNVREAQLAPVLAALDASIDALDGYQASLPNQYIHVPRPVHARTERTEDGRTVTVRE